MKPILRSIKDLIIHFDRKFNIYRVRHKNQINVVFVVNDLAVWKTEPLYKIMTKHLRFNPVLAVSPSRENPQSYVGMMEYLKMKGYDFLLLDGQKRIKEQLPTDIIIYEKPYEDFLSENHNPSKNRWNLMVYTPYGFTNIMESWNYNLFIFSNLWQYYQENEICAAATKEHLSKNKKCVLVTGTPMMDDLAQPKEAFSNPWKDTKSRKCIIYAPHHTIGNQHLSGISYSTFLEYGDFVLQLAQKYADKTYWAFKPHPLLKDKLAKEWGKERAESYYQAWEDLENAQVENGKYIGLFKYSDAMIHDCSTFTQEYMYANRPVMFLVKDSHHTDNLNDFAKTTFNLHVHGWNKEDIERFVIDVINGRDEKKKEREAFYGEAMLPPHGKSACKNIINAILGKEQYA